MGPRPVDLPFHPSGRVRPRWLGVNRVETPVGSLPDFSMWEEYGWTAGFLGDPPFPPPLHSGAALQSPQSPASALKTSLIKAAQISSLHFWSGLGPVVLNFTMKNHASTHTSPRTGVVLDGGRPTLSGLLQRAAAEVHRKRLPASRGGRWTRDVRLTAFERSTAGVDCGTNRNRLTWWRFDEAYGSATTEKRPQNKTSSLGICFRDSSACTVGGWMNGWTIHTAKVSSAQVENKTTFLMRMFGIGKFPPQGAPLGGGKPEIPEKTHRPAASFGKIPTCETQGVTWPGIEPRSPWLEASRITAQLP
ncbi:hypothetical protein PR048_029106 [Dryococelus australis]|uniref:Uncharacterized protein n=1 Tax=Dryococelus australis TaxID=614101 RepID=A0ABQ9GCF7_9NEOP|nr:hypothetical protein PR048_029106 [Dryococelus australis]